ncbi:unnamed protein product [Allacma fusca]|nr:unnamed protein product [Allacma fusca]
MTQYDLIDFSDIPKEEYESTGAHTTNPEGSVSASISATTIRDNLAQEEMNNSKYSSLRGRVEDCLQNWQWYQSEKNEPDPDQKSEAEFYIEEFPNTKVENMPPNEFPLEKDSAGVCSQVQIDKHSFGDAVFASVRGKRSKRPGGSRKFCIIM